MQTKNTGRKAGAKNKFTAKQKQEMFEVLLPMLKTALKSMSAMEPHQKVRLLLDFLPYFLPKGVVTEEETEVQAMIYEHLEPHYKRLAIYFNHVPPEKRPAMLKSYLSLFATKQKATILPTISQQLKPKKAKTS